MAVLRKSSYPFCYILFLLGLFLLFTGDMPVTMAKLHSHDFVVQATPENRLCKTRSTITVNGMFPGPTLLVNNGDTLEVKVTNKARYKVTIHWHGARQIRTGWADGPEFVTQCPIRPGGSYTYRFTIQGQEGTLRWHAHSSWLRATFYGALIIRPKEGDSYPFAKPTRETPLLLGEWWDANPINVVRQAQRTGSATNISDAYTINGQPDTSFDEIIGRRPSPMTDNHHRPFAATTPLIYWPENEETFLKSRRNSDRLLRNSIQTTVIYDRVLLPW